MRSSTISIDLHSKTTRKYTHDLRRQVKQNLRSEKVSSEHTNTKLQSSTHKPTMKSTIRQYLHDLKIHVKQMYPESGNIVELQSSSSSLGCKLEKVRALFPLLLQCPEKVPETGNIAYIDPNRPRFSFDEVDDKHISVVKRKFSFDEGDDRHLFFVKPRRPPIQFKPACELKRVSPLYSSATSTIFPRVF